MGEGQQLDLGREPLLSMALSHPNLLPSYKTCCVRVLAGADAEAASPTSPASPVDSAGGSARSGAPTPRPVRPSLTDRNTLVELMPAHAVLEPG